MKDRPLVAARFALRSHGFVMLGVTALATVVVLGVFDWPVREVFYGGLLGVVVWGVAEWLGQVRHEVPRAAALPAVPAGEPVLLRVKPRARILLLVLPLVVGLAWLADWWDAGAIFVPGQFAGTAVANLVAAALVRRWEREHGRQVVAGRDRSGDPKLYAAALPGYTGSVQTSAIDGS